MNCQELIYIHVFSINNDILRLYTSVELIDFKTASGTRVGVNFIADFEKPETQSFVMPKMPDTVSSYQSISWNIPLYLNFTPS